MGIRKSTGKNKKSRKRAPAIAVRREEVQRRAASDRSKSRPQGMR
jgi:hypothetical protein